MNKFMQKLLDMTEPRPLPEAETVWPPQVPYPQWAPGEMLVMIEQQLRTWAEAEHNVILNPDNRKNPNTLAAAYYRREAYLECLELIQDYAQHYEDAELDVPSFMDETNVTKLTVPNASEPQPA